MKIPRLANVLFMVWFIVAMLILVGLSYVVFHFITKFW